MRPVDVVTDFGTSGVLQRRWLTTLHLTGTGQAPRSSDELTLRREEGLPWACQLATYPAWKFQITCASPAERATGAA